MKEPVHERTGSMNAVGFRAFGGPEVLGTDVRPIPVPRRGQLRVRVAAAGVNPADWRLRNGQFRWFMRTRFPFVPGCDVSGVVDAVGEEVRHFAPGDAVYGMLPPVRAGGFAEYAILREDETAAAPAGVSLAESAAVPLAALTALQALRDRARLVAGRRVLVNGASGGVGSFAVQIARALGAHVTAACSARNADFVVRLGANEAVDYAGGGLERLGKRFDVVFDAVGVLPFTRVDALLWRGGVHVSVNPGIANPARALLVRATRGKRLEAVFVRASGADLVTLGGWIAERRVVPPIEETFALSSAADALARSEGGHVRGKLVLICDPELASLVPRRSADAGERVR